MVCDIHSGIEPSGYPLFLPTPTFQVWRGAPNDLAELWLHPCQLSRHTIGLRLTPEVEQSGQVIDVEQAHYSSFIIFLCDRNFGS